MRITTKGRYGVRVMLDIAMHGPEGKVKLKDVSKRQAISEKYLWQIVAPLKAAGLLRAVAGPAGGYELARPAAAISLRDIFEAVEGDCALVECVRSPTVCRRSGVCAVREIWNELQARLADVMGATTLSDMVARQGALMAEGPAEYVI